MTDSVSKTIGYTLFIICSISFLLIPVVALLGLPAAKIAGISLVLIIIGEVTFYLSLVFLGKGFYNKIKEKLKFRKSKTGTNTSLGPSENNELE
ncbi:MAG: transporter suffix domain-containing protein [Bacteroidales bacterium]|jgi:hypothetical protein|nr:transporter suffix domain-containing protein [Bacteroidales bacterium]